MSFHDVGFVVPMPVLLELSIDICVCVCVCVYACREGALDGLDFFLKKKTTKTKQMGLYLFMPVANNKADPQGLSFCCFSI